MTFGLLALAGLAAGGREGGAALFKTYDPAFHDGLVLDEANEWTRFNAIVQAFRERAPHVVVKYTSDMDGNTIRIGLPSPITAYLSRTDIEVVES